MSGLADAENTGGVVDGMAARFAKVDAERMRELDRLIRTNAKLNTEPKMPSRDGDTKGDEMAERKPKSCCGSKGPRHCSGCKEAGETKAPKSETKSARIETIRRAAAKRAAPKPGGAKLGNYEAYTVDELLDAMQVCREELARREAQLREQLEQITKAREEAA